jgi:hypothetical protein
MINESDLVPGRPLKHKGERVTYIGRSSTGGFVIELPMKREAGVPKIEFKTAWPFELELWTIS